MFDPLKPLHPPSGAMLARRCCGNSEGLQLGSFDGSKAGPREVEAVGRTPSGHFLQGRARAPQGHANLPCHRCAHCLKNKWQGASWSLLPSSASTGRSLRSKECHVRLLFHATSRQGIRHIGSAMRLYEEIRNGYHPRPPNCPLCSKYHPLGATRP